MATCFNVLFLSTMILFSMTVKAQNSTFLCNDTSSDCNIQCVDADDCQEMTIDLDILNISTNINLECIGDYSCQSLLFYENENTQNISTTIECIGLRSCFLSQFYLTTNKEISIYCGKDEYACSNMEIYCQQCENVNIYFLDSSCSQSDIEIDCFIHDKECHIQCQYRYIELFCNSFILNTKSSVCITQKYSCFYPLAKNEYVIDNELQCDDNALILFNNLDITTNIIWDINYMQNCSSLIKRQFICNNNSNCSIHRDLVNCMNVNVNARHALSLHYICEETICSNSNIYCPHGNCFIQCATNSDCNNLQIFVYDGYSIYFECYSYSNCRNIIIYAKYAQNIQILLYEGYDTLPRYISIYANYTNITNIIAEGTGAMNMVNVYAMNANQLNIICYGGLGQLSCDGANIYLSQSLNNNIHCDGFGCKNMSFYYTNPNVIKSMNVSMNGCDIICDNVFDCSSPWHLYCYDNINCTDDIYNEINMNFINDYFQCKTIDNGLICASNNKSSCSLECERYSSVCNGKSIFTDAKEELSITCDGSWACNNMFISCRGVKKCNIVCGYSCKALDIYLDDETYFQLYCNGGECANINIFGATKEIIGIYCSGKSCHDFNIYGLNAKYIDVSCSSCTAYCDDRICWDMFIHATNAMNISFKCNTNWMRPCYDIYIFAEHATGIISYKAIGGSSTKNVSIYANYSNVVDIIAKGYGSSVYNLFVYAMNANILNMNCYGMPKAFNSKSCSNSHIYSSLNHNNLYCEGLGCQGIFWYYKNNITMSLDITINICGKPDAISQMQSSTNICSDAASCIGEWNLYCNYSINCVRDTTNIVSYYEQNSVFINDYRYCDKSDTLICYGDNNNYTNYRECRLDCNNNNCQDATIFSENTDIFTLNCVGKKCLNLYIDCRDVTECNILCSFGDCKNIIVWIDEADKLLLNCSKKNSKNEAKCVNINVFANNIETIYIRCDRLNGTQGYVCNNLNIYASNVSNQIQFITNGKNATNNIKIIAEDYVENIVVYGGGDKCLRNITINAINANKLSLIVYGDYGSNVVFGSNSLIYLSEYENHIILEGVALGDVKIYSMTDNININNISINTCSKCDDGTDCIKHWQLYCNYDQEIAVQQPYELVCDGQGVKALIDLINQNLYDDFLNCHPESDTSIVSNNNNTLSIFSILFGIISITVIILWFLFFVYNLCDILCKKMKGLFITNRPGNYILFGSFIADFVILSSVYWWALKHTLFYKNIRLYCKNRYPNNIKDNFEFCNNDYVCNVWNSEDGEYNKVNSDLFDCQNEYFNDDYYTSCICYEDQGIYAIMCTFWVICSINTLSEFIRFICACKSYSNFKNRSNKTIIKLFGSQCICCLFRLGENGRNEIRELFWKRDLWIRMDQHTMTDTNYCCFIFDAIFRFLMYVILACLSMELYGNESYDSDFAIKSYELYPIIALILLKMIIQSYYAFCGKEFEIQKEYPPRIMQILKNVYGIDIANIIKTYLPMFYDKNKCVKYYLLKQAEIELQASNITTTDY
eukprot:368348_1